MGGVQNLNEKFHLFFFYFLNPSLKIKIFVWPSIYVAATFQKGPILTNIQTLSGPISCSNMDHLGSFEKHTDLGNDGICASLLAVSECPQLQ